MLIALVGVLAFAAVWFTVLRPKPAAEEGAIVTPVSQTPAATQAATPASSGNGVTDQPAKAQAAVDAATGQAASNQAAAEAAATGTPSAAASTETPATGATATPATDATSSAATATETPATNVTTEPGVPAGERAVLRQLADGKVVVMLFWDKSGADDRAARRAVASATKGRKNVAVRLVGPDKVGSYEAITGGVTIAQTPTTLVIGPERKAVTISGLIDPLEIKQAIGRMTPAKG
ncbi:hypothetical protein LRS13_18520 [Svornostia abyssi]|uniref:Thioredoxin domain-containing protein n=1 Tax=Svornostia abyssi TaxID=2898438 RepID=A0ABY5PDT0_9ACTN|nr:hypothetical protein LRS13_18520 [Parviterribacteraceae bacterium J379]